MAVKRVTVIDSHTGGEPTRTVIHGGPELDGDLARQRLAFQRDHDAFRSAVVNEPRGSDVVVGALLRSPQSPDAAAGVIFFNNVDVLNMCGHGTIGLVVTLAHLQMIQPGTHRIETPAGPVSATLTGRNQVTVKNVASYRYRKAVSIQVPGHGTVTGDVAWGGNWFFLVANHGKHLLLADVDELRSLCIKIRAALNANGVTGVDGAEIDHVELFADSETADSRNFVLCPGGAYDRSPCGTGTSAKVACLAADGKLAAGAAWRQESIVGSIFEASWEAAPEAEIPADADGVAVIPSITGTAYVNAESVLLLDDEDPFCMGIRG